MLVIDCTLNRHETRRNNRQSLSLQLIRKFIKVLANNMLQVIYDSTSVSQILINFCRLLSLQLHSDSPLGLLRSRSDDPTVADWPRQVPMATRRASLHLAAWRVDADVRSVSAAESEPRWGDHSRGLPRRGKLIGERLHPNVRALRAVPWIQNRRAESHWSDWHDSGYVTENFHLRWVSHQQRSASFNFRFFLRWLSTKIISLASRRCQTCLHCDKWEFQTSAVLWLGWLSWQSSVINKGRK